jgi:hypothetical protein
MSKSGYIEIASSQENASGLVSTLFNFWSTYNIFDCAADNDNKTLLKEILVTAETIKTNHPFFISIFTKQLKYPNFGL